MHKLNGRDRLSRIILANQPRLLREMIKRVILKSGELQLVGEIAHRANLNEIEEIIEQTGAQWIVLTLSADGEISEETKTLLVNHPTLSVLAVAMDGSQFKVLWTDPQLTEKDLSSVSLAELVDVLHERDLGKTEEKDTENK
jgi:hypothetical protein